MTLDDYQQAALRTDSMQGKENALFHLLLGLCGETGEIAEKAKKIVRDQDSDFSKWDRDDIVKELGDVMWHVAVTADYFDISLDEIAEKNIAKLADRMKRNMISGSGDNR